MPESIPSVALVTGATEGIGRAIAFALGQAGYRVGVCARTAERLEQLVGALEEEGIEAAGVPGDVGVETSARTIVHHVTEKLGPVDTLVNNAGTAILKPVEKLTLAEWDVTMATNVRSMFLLSREVIPGMRKRKSGAIVNIASLAARNGFAGGTAYVASKHAVLGFSRALMMEVRKDDIRVITILPGSVDTALQRNQGVLKPDYERILRTEDVAQAVLSTLQQPERALVSELDLRPTNP